MRSPRGRPRRGCSRSSRWPSCSSRRTRRGWRSGSRHCSPDCHLADQKLAAMMVRRRAGFRASVRPAPNWAPRSSRRTAASATSSAARGRGSARSSMASAAAGSTGSSRTSSTRTATLTRRSASPPWPGERPGRLGSAAPGGRRDPRPGRRPGQGGPRPEVVRRRAQYVAPLADAGQPLRPGHPGRLQQPARLPAPNASRPTRRWCRSRLIRRVPAFLPPSASRA